MSNVDFASFHTTYPCWLLFEYACVSTLVSAIVAMVVYIRTCGVEISKYGRGPVDLRACLFWCFQISTSFGKNRLVHL